MTPWVRGSSEQPHKGTAVFQRCRNSWGSTAATSRVSSGTSSRIAPMTDSMIAWRCPRAVVGKAVAMNCSRCRGPEARDTRHGRRRCKGAEIGRQVGLHVLALSRREQAQERAKDRAYRGVLGLGWGPTTMGRCQRARSRHSRSGWQRRRSPVNVHGFDVGEQSSLLNRLKCRVNRT
jgi:hypothetical protein